MIKEDGKTCQNVQFNFFLPFIKTSLNYTPLIVLKANPPNQLIFHNIPQPIPGKII